MTIKKRKLKKIEDEVWKDIPNNSFYQISNYGRIKSYYINKKEGKILKFSEIKGFKQVSLTLNNIQRTYYVHKLVAEVWIPKPSKNHTYVTHLDGNLINNHISNLEWHTKESLQKQHQEFKIKLNNSKSVTNSRLKVSDIRLLKSMLQRGVVQAKIAKMFCISEMQVTRIKRGENWGNVKPFKSNEQETIEKNQ